MSSSLHSDRAKVLKTLNQPKRLDSLRQQLVEILKEAIFSAKFQPGEALRELPLARSFSVSQATVREALLHLQRLGLAVHVPNKGTSVTQLSSQEVRDRLRLRVVLEELACLEACQRLGEEDFVQLEQLSCAISDSVARGGDFEIGQADLNFHRYIWDKSGNQILSNTLEQLTTPLFAFVSLLRKFGLEDVIDKPHGPIVEALRTRNPETVSDAIRAHIQGSYQAFLASGVNSLHLVIQGER